MNVPVRPPQADASRAPITPEERARRQALIDYARGSLRLEGLIVPDDVEALNRRYIDGEITREELSAAIRANYRS